MHLSRTSRLLLRAGTAITLAFLYVPLLVIALYAFNSRRTLKWPIPGLTHQRSPSADCTSCNSSTP